MRRLLPIVRRAAMRRTAFSGAARRARSGAILVWFALLLTVLLGMVGLVIDAGLLMAAHRQAQNAADAGALAAAKDLMWGKSTGTAAATAATFVTQYNGQVNAPVVNIPPAQGPYQGMSRFAEVIVTNPMQTFFIHILPGVAQNQTVQARAVAGSESITSGEGVAVLDPDARPGLAVSGGGTLKVLGLVVDNSEGGGVDEDGNPSLTAQAGKTGNAASGGNMPSPTTGTFASEIHVVGGVDKPANFKNIDPANPLSPLRCNELPMPDPLLPLPTPATVDGTNLAKGVDATGYNPGKGRGTVDATNQNLSFDDPTGKNRVVTSGGVSTLNLYPGIYESISITGGNVKLWPGIYVLAPQQNTTNALKITGGNVNAEGIMFYNTGNSYNANNGNPDVNDGENKPPQKPSDLGDSTAYWGSFQINAGMKFSPIDHTKFTYGSADGGYYTGPNPSTAFEGMLFYQRRRSNTTMSITGNSADGQLSGTLYAKWANVQISGQGTYDAQFIVGSISVTGQGNVTINYSGKKLGKAPAVFLVE